MSWYRGGPNFRRIGTTLKNSSRQSHVCTGFMPVGVAFSNSLEQISYNLDAHDGTGAEETMEAPVFPPSCAPMRRKTGAGWRLLPFPLQPRLESNLKF